MIAQLIGKIIKKEENSLFIETDIGIVFEVTCPQYTSEKLINENMMIRLHTYLFIREDQITLFGFLSEHELKLFKYLISVPDIGPKKAISILSKETYQKIINAIISSDIRFLSSIPGIGNKTAEKIIIELKDKLRELSSISIPQEGRLDKSLQDELYSALINLGYKSNQVEKAIANLKNIGNNDFNSLLKEALNIIKSI